jgi:hypothetical protein
MIFKQGSCAEELFEGMQNAQQETLLEESQKNEQLIYTAMQELNAAAKSFERIGRTARAEEVTAVMVSLAENNDLTIDQTEDTSMEEAAKVFEFLGL